MGESCVPLEAARVVVLDTGELDIALALGITPVGAVTPYEIGRFPAYLRDRTQGIVPVGTINQPDLERIIGLKPDVILSSKKRHASIYPQLAAIAPTVFSEDIGVSWKGNLELFAKALGRQDRGAAILDRYRGHLEYLRTKLGASGSPPTISMVRGMPDHVRIYLQDSFIGSVLGDAGLLRPPGQQGDGSTIKLRSPDGIEWLVGDIVLVSFYGAKTSSMLYEWMQSPFWSLLASMESDAVHEVDDSYWMLGLGPLAAIRVVEDLERILTNG